MSDTDTTMGDPGDTLPPPATSPGPETLPPPPGDAATRALETGGELETITGVTQAAIPERIGAFEIEGVLGRGGMGAVYAARSVDLDRRVALKVVLPGVLGSQGLERFTVEARAAARLRHPNIVGVHEVGQDGDQHYLVMDLIEGESLRERIQREGPLPEREAARLTKGVAEALAFAHTRAILHRDVKPANILLTESGEPVLTDFGLAKVEQSDEGLTHTGQVIGTPSYMPPEQAEGHLDRIDRRTDVYSLGATLYAMLTGRPPFEGSTAINILSQVLEKEPVAPARLRPGVDQDLETVCLKCLEKESARRYPSASDLAADLARFLRHQPILARRPTRAERARKWLRRNSAIAWSLGVTILLALIVIGVGAAYSIERLTDERDEADHAREEAEDARADEERQRERAEGALADARVQKQRAEHNLHEMDLAFGHALEEKGGDAARQAKWGQAAVLLATALAKEDLPGRRQALLLALDSTWEHRRVLAGVYAEAQRPLSWSPGGRFLVAQPTPDVLTLHTRDGTKLGELKGDFKAWSADGARLATLGKDRRVRIWDPTTCRAVATFEALPGEPTGVWWSPDGARIASSSQGQPQGRLRFFDARGSRLLADQPTNGLGVYRILWQPGGQLAASVTEDAVQLWDVRRGALLSTLKGAQRPVAWSPNGRWLAVANGKQLLILRGTKQVAALPLAGRAIAWSSQGNQLAVGTYRGGIQVFSIPAGALTAELPSNTRDVTSMTWSADGMLAAGRISGNVLLWAGRKQETPLEIQDSLNTGWLSWSPDGRRLSGFRDWTKTFHVWDRGGTLRRQLVDVSTRRWDPTKSRLATGARTGGYMHLWWRRAGLARARVLRGHDREIKLVACSVDGRRVASSDRDGGLRIWDGVTGDPLATHKFAGQQDAIRWSPSGHLLASSGWDGAIRLYGPDGAPKSVLQQLPEKSKQPAGGATLSWSPTGDRLATSVGPTVTHEEEFLEASVSVWDANSWKRLAKLGAGASVLAWSPDGKRLAGGGDEVWVWQDGRVEQLPEPFGGSADVLAWSPDGTLLAAGSGDRTLKIWRGGEILATAEGHEDGIVGLAWSADGRLATASEDGTIRLWSSQGEPLKTLKGHEGGVLAVAWAPRGRLLASASRDRTVRLWDGRSGAQRAMLVGHENAVTALVWSGDGARLVSASVDRTVRFWDVAGSLTSAKTLLKRAQELTDTKVDVLNVVPR